MRKFFTISLFFFFSVFVEIETSLAESVDWCEFTTDLDIVSEGMERDNVWLYGRFVGTKNDRYVLITEGERGKHNLALALAAKMGGKRVAIKIAKEGIDCKNMPHQFTEISRLKIVD